MQVADAFVVVLFLLLSTTLTQWWRDCQVMHETLCNCYRCVCVQITVTAQDNAGSNQQFASASVIVTVLRDLFPPLFTNLPTSVTLDEKQAINRTVFTATANDADLEVRRKGKGGGKRERGRETRGVWERGRQTDRLTDRQRQRWDWEDEGATGLGERGRRDKERDREGDKKDHE